MQRTEFRSETLPREGRWLAWNQSLARFAVDTDGFGSAFDGQIDTCAASSGLSFTLLQSRAPQRLSAARGQTGNVFWLALILSGSSILDLGGEPIAMTRGDLLYGKRGAPASLHISTQFRMLLVNIPGELLSRKAMPPLPAKAVHLSGRSGLGRILSGMLEAVAESLDDLDEAVVGPIEDAVAQFLLASLLSEREAAGSAGPRAAVLQRVMQAIEPELDNPHLSVGRIAEGQGLTVRYVQKLFEETGQSFTRYVRRRRLEQCRSDLANPLNGQASITRTCFRWGFNDAATFSRAFREEYGVSPRAYRKAIQVTGKG